MSGFAISERDAAERDAIVMQQMAAEYLRLEGLPIEVVRRRLRAQGFDQDAIKQAALRAVVRVSQGSSR